MPPSFSGQRGALLLEQGLALALLAAVAALSVQMWRGMGQDRQLQSLVERVAAARLAALSLGCVRLCMRDGGQECQLHGVRLVAQSCPEGNSRSPGSTGSPRVLASWRMEGARLVWRGLSRARQLDFDARGRSSGGTGSLWVCSRAEEGGGGKGDALARIVVNRDGRLRLETAEQMAGKKAPC